jgi:hypothetical protein
MKSIDLSKLSYERLQSYRKTLTDKQHAWNWYGIGESVVDELTRVLTECRRRNKFTIAQQKRDKWAHIPTLKELNPKYKYKKK